MSGHNISNGQTISWHGYLGDTIPKFLRRFSANVKFVAAYLWQGPPTLPQVLRLEWRFVAIRWLGILFLVLTLLLFELPTNSLPGVYTVIAIASIYNLGLQLSLLRRANFLISGYITTACDGLLNIAMIVVAGGFDSPFYYILYTVTVSAAMRYGYGPVLAMALLFVSSDFVEDIILGQATDAAFIFRSAFLILTAILAGYLHEQAQTAKKALEERLNEATALNKELEAFSYSVSHDLRAPLRSIDGFSQALLEDYNDILDEDGQDYLHRVRAASQRMAQLIDDLLNLSRVTRSEIIRESVDLSALAYKVASDLQQPLFVRRADFIITPGIIAHADPQLLCVVLENLLGNALKFTYKQTQARIEFGVTRHEGRPAYFVRDNGVGFDMAYVNKLFGAFQRLHSANEIEGNGIGLATVQRIIHRHGGQVWGEGNVNQGATFYFTL